MENISIDWLLLLLQTVQAALFLGGAWLLLFRPLSRQVERRKRLAIRTEADRERARTELNDVQAKRIELLNKARDEARALQGEVSEEQGTKVPEVAVRQQERAAILLLEEHFARK